MNIQHFLDRSELTRTLQTFHREFWICIIFSMVINILMLTPTLYMLQVFDRVMISQSELTLYALTLIMLFLYGVSSFSEWSRSRLLVRTGVKLDEHLNSRIFNASFESHLSQIGKNPTQAFSDLTQVRQFITGNGIFALMDAPWIPIYMIVVFMLHPFLGYLSLAFAGVQMCLAYLSHRLTHSHIENAMESSSNVNNYLFSKLRNSEAIESLGMLNNLQSRWKNLHHRYLLLNATAQDWGHRVQAISKFFSYTQQSLVLGAGALLVIEGELSAGSMIAANVLMGKALQPIQQIVGSWKPFLSARISFLRIEELLQKFPERPAGAIHPAPDGYMQLKQLVATVPNRSEPILKGLTADFPSGNVIAIIGPSGSGKSTLARSLIGIWPDMQGDVLLDGESVQSWNRDELGPYLGYLPQDIELFDGTIAENIARFGEIDSAKVIRAAEHAGVHDMILRFPKGYDTPMGEAGGMLSGGQRQRIGLARAMYGDPSVLVLDEPNANLDDAGEAALVKAVQTLKQEGKTVFLITHRMNIIGVADRILVLRDGEIQIYGPRQDVIQALQTANAPRNA